MVNWFNTKRPVLLIGLVCAVIYIFYFGYCLYLEIFMEKSEARIALAFVSFPTSAVVFSLGHSLLLWLGPYGSASRRAGEWFLLGLAGVTQYFLVGLGIAIAIGKSWRDDDSKTSV